MTRTALERWTTACDRLIARRDKLRTELESIEAALKSPTTPPQTKSIRRARPISGNSRRVEEYLRTHPNKTSREIATALGVEINKVNNPLLYMLQHDKVVRHQEDGSPWIWSMKSDAEKAQP